MNLQTYRQHTHTSSYLILHRYIILTAIFQGKPGSAGYPLIFLRSFGAEFERPEAHSYRPAESYWASDFLIKHDFWSSLMPVQCPMLYYEEWKLIIIIIIIIQTIVRYTLSISELRPVPSWLLLKSGAFNSNHSHSWDTRLLRVPLGAHMHVPISMPSVRLGHTVWMLGSGTWCVYSTEDH